MTYLLAFTVFVLGAPHMAELYGFDSFNACMAYAKQHTSRTVKGSCYRAEYHAFDCDCRFELRGKSVVAVIGSALCTVVKQEAKL